MGRPHDLGRRGEELASRELARRGWRILARNYRAGRKEIDVIAMRDRVVAFVEVKTRTGSGYGHPLEAITAAKKREIAYAAREWIARNGEPGLVYRFDAIAVVSDGTGPPTVEHVADAWRL